MPAPQPMPAADFEDSGDFDPPLPPPGLTPVERHTFDMQAWFARAVIAEQKSMTRKLSGCLAEGERAAQRRTDAVIDELREVKAAVGGVKAVVDREHLGPIGRFGAWIDTMPAVKASVGMSVAVFIGGLLLAVAGYLGFGSFNLPSTPTPVQVVAPPS